MNALLTESFSVESKEAQELIHEIKTSFENQDKEAFLNSKKSVLEAAFNTTSNEEEIFFSNNLYKILQQLPTLTSFSYIESLTKEEKNNRLFYNIAGHSDEMYEMLDEFTTEAKAKEDQEVLNIINGKAFYQQ